MNRGRWGIGGIALAALGMLAAGCTGSGDTPDPPPLPAASVAAARYSGLAGECPTLNSPAAKRYGTERSGARDPNPLTSNAPGATVVRCTWSSAGTGSALAVTVDIHPDGFPPAGTGAGNARSLFDNMHSDAEKDAEKPDGFFRLSSDPLDSAFTLAFGPGDDLVQATLADNAVVRVRLTERETFPEDPDAYVESLLRRLKPDATAITAEVIGQLR